MAKKKEKGQTLSYFLDHPQIKRHKSPGNGNKPGTLAEKINWGNKNTAAQNAKIKNEQPPKSTTTSTTMSNLFSAIKSGFKK